MQQSLRLVHGTDIIYLSGPGINLQARFIPSAPGPNDEDVTESIVVVFSKRALIQSINKFFELARRNAMLRISGAVYLEFKPDISDPDYYRSEILDGTVSLETASADKIVDGSSIEGMIAWTRVPYWEGALTQLALSNNVDASTLSGTRVFNPAKCLFVAVAFDQPTHEIRSGTGTGMDRFKTGEYIGVVNSTSNNFIFKIATGNIPSKVIVDPVYLDVVTEAAGATVALFGAPCNSVDMAGADIKGDLPTPPMIKLTSKSGVPLGFGFARPNKAMFIAHNIFSDVNNFEHILQAKDGFGGGGVLTWTLQNNDILSMYGTHGKCDWNVTAETRLCLWALTSSQVNALKNNYFRLLLHLPYLEVSGYTDLWLKFKVTNTLSTIYSESEWVLYEGDELSVPGVPSYPDIIELGTVQLPGTLEGADNLRGINLEIYVKKASAGPNTIYVDYLQLSPLDGWRKLVEGNTGMGYGASLDDEFIDDNIERWIYCDMLAGVSGKAGDFYTASAPIMLLPGQDQRLYFLRKNDISLANLSIDDDVKVWYRPRRSTV